MLLPRLALLLALSAAPVTAQEPAVSAVPLSELELAEGALMPRYGGAAPWTWSQDEGEYPRAALEGEGEVVFLAANEAAHDVGAFWLGRAQDPLGALLIRTDAPREVRGTLFVPRASGGGFVRLAFRVPAERATLGEDAFRAAELQRLQRLLLQGAPGGAWFRHRYDALGAQLGEPFSSLAELPNPLGPFRGPDEALDLFTGGRALYENLQLERGLPAGGAGPAEVALDTLEGIVVRAFDWSERLADATPALDPLAAWIPADQHALFFPRFEGFLEVLDEVDRSGGSVLSGLDGRGSAVDLRKRYETQLCLTLDELARTLGPLAIQSVALTGSDPYLRAGTDLAVLLEVRPEFAVRVHDLILAGQEAAGFVLEPSADGKGSLTRSPAREINSHVFHLTPADDTGPVVLAVTNSILQSTRLQAVARGAEPGLATTDEYRFFRQRYTLGAESESALLVLPDAAIRRWCSPRWRIGAARRVGAAAALAEEHARHLEQLANGLQGTRVLGPDADFPDLGVLRLSSEGVHSVPYGTLDFLTPIAELALTHVTQREADLYRRWRDGFQRAWSNYFDPIAARLSVSEEGLDLDLTVMPLILGTEYSDLREATRGPGLAPGDGDPHDSALVHFALAVNPEWEPLKSIGQSFGPLAEKLGAHPLGWLGSWVALYLDPAPIWDDVLQAEDLEQVLDLQERLNEVPLAVTIAVAKPLELALFLSALRSFVDGTAPGMTEWKERTVGERRFVELGSPGLSASARLFYATLPEALILSLNEATLLSAMARAQARAGAEAAPRTDPGPGVHAGLELRGAGFRLLEVFLGSEAQRVLRRSSWANLPILNEWKRRWPDSDPVALQTRLFREHLVCPGGGTYVWNAAWNTMESTVFGHPAEPGPGVRLPPAWQAFSGLRSRLTFEEDGLRVRLALARE